MGLLVVRGLVVILGLFALVWLSRKPRLAWRHLTAFLFEPSSAVNLALLRIIVFAFVARDAFKTTPIWYAELPRALRVAPPGWGWLLHSPILEPEALAVGRWLLIVAAPCAVVGLFTRVTVPLATLLMIYLPAVTLFFDKVNHGTHFLALCAMVLSFAPCADALSVDRLWKHFRGYAAPAPSSAYGLPMRFCWLLLGTTYFFPGFWKLWNVGDRWFTG